jgi:hypothetical protein
MPTIGLKIKNADERNVCQNLSDFLNVLGYNCINKTNENVKTECRLGFEKVNDMSDCSIALNKIKSGNWGNIPKVPFKILSSPYVVIDI